jgi:hypothetical protein
MEGTNASEVREDDAAHLVMKHDGTGDDAVGGGGGKGCGGGEGCGGEDDDEDNEEDEDFLDDMLRQVEQELLLKGLDNLETVWKARKERLYPEEKGCEKR